MGKTNPKRKDETRLRSNRSKSPANFDRKETSRDQATNSVVAYVNKGKRNAETSRLNRVDDEERKYRKTGQRKLVQTTNSEITNEITEIQFNEDGNVLQMTVEGNSKNAEEEEGEIMDDDEDSEVTLNIKGHSNNATALFKHAEKEMSQITPTEMGLNNEKLISDAMARVQDLITRSQMETTTLFQKQLDEVKAAMSPIDKTTEFTERRNRQEQTSKISPNSSGSEVTVYTNAVKGILTQQNEANLQRRNSSSEEEPMDTSDEILVENEDNHVLMEHQDTVIPTISSNVPKESDILKFITDQRPNQDERRVVQIQRKSTGGLMIDDQQPSTSRFQNQERLTPDQRADKLVKDAEAVKARILEAPGNTLLHQNRMLDVNSDFVHSAMVDESFLLVVSHIDQITYDKIVNGEYVDFSRLIPKDKVLIEEENKMQLVNKDGQIFFVPANSDKTSISNFSRWEQAFRVFCDVYTRAHPNRSSELVQYNHIIHTASMSYNWDNVYLYDKDFRLHMSRHPSRSWALMLQQSWTLRLKDRIIRHENNNRTFNDSSKSSPGSGHCRRFNRGKCSYGHTCKYEHRCYYCNKVGHGVVACRQMKYDRNDRDRNNDRYHKDNRDSSNSNSRSYNYNHQGGNNHQQGNNNNQNKLTQQEKEKK